MPTEIFHSLCQRKKGQSRCRSLTVQISLRAKGGGQEGGGQGGVVVGEECVEQGE